MTGVQTCALPIFVPLWATISFAVLSLSGLKLLRIRVGKVTMSDKMLKEILKAQPAEAGAPFLGDQPMTTALGAPAAAAPLQAGPPAAMATSLPNPKKGDDVVVSLMGPPPSARPTAALPEPPPEPPKG